MHDPIEITGCLQSSNAGDSNSTEKLFEILYETLHQQAVRIFSAERHGHSLQPTALVHEAFLRLVGSHDVDWQSRRHFLLVATATMRRVLTDYARAQHRLKRGGAWKKLEEIEDRHLSLSSDDDVLSVHEALECLEKIDPRQAQIVELRFFGGLSHAQVSDVLGISLRTVEADWAHAKTWLRRELSD